MKFLFGTNVTKGTGSYMADGQNYIKSELPDSLQDLLDRREEELEIAAQNARLPLVLQILKWISLSAGLICMLGVLKADVSLAQGYQNAPYFYWIAGIGIPVGGVLWIVEKLREKGMENKDAMKQARRASQEAEKNADAFLHIPGDAKKVDVLIFDYKTKNGVETIKGPAVNEALRMYAQDGDLCLTDGTEVYAIPLKSVTGLRLIYRACALLGWNKGDSPDQEKYKKCGLVTQRGGADGLKFCCALEWSDGGEIWQLLFPAWELSKFEKLTGEQGPTLPDVKSKPAKGSVEELALRYDGKVRPRFYWRVPKDENAASWLSPASDTAFRIVHPKLYTLLVLIGILFLFLPMFGFLFAAFTMLPDVNSPWLILGTAGGFVLGIGLFNIVGAWLEQYLGHWVTILCIVLGAGMMAASWLLLAA